MPSAQDILNAINTSTDAVNNNTTVIGGKLDTVNADLTAVAGKLDTVHNDLTAIAGKLDTIDAEIKLMRQQLLFELEQLITLGHYTNQALFQNDQQNDTMICVLKQISVNTCGIWNEAHTQTELQKGIGAATQRLAKLYAATHGDAAVTLDREEELRRQIEACCPPVPPAPVCVQEPCVAPPPFKQQPPAPQPPPTDSKGL